MRGERSFPGKSVVVLDFVLIELCNQAFSIGTSCVLLVTAFARNVPAPELRAKLLRRKTFPGIDGRGLPMESAKKTGGAEAGTGGTR